MPCQASSIIGAHGRPRSAAPQPNEPRRAAPPVVPAAHRVSWSAGALIAPAASVAAAAAAAAASEEPSTEATGAPAAAATAVIMAATAPVSKRFRHPLTALPPRLPLARDDALVGASLSSLTDAPTATFSYSTPLPQLPAAASATLSRSGRLTRLPASATFGHSGQLLQLPAAASASLDRSV